jgi:hypothetical protein
MDDHNATYVFIFFGNDSTSREDRQKMLNATGLAAKQVTPQNDMLIAIATELHMIKSRNYSLEWMMLDMDADEFEEELGAEAREYRKKLNIWKNPVVQRAQSWEYPSDARKKRKKK